MARVNHPKCRAARVGYYDEAPQGMFLMRDANRAAAEVLEVASQDINHFMLEEIFTRPGARGVLSGYQAIVVDLRLNQARKQRYFQAAWGGACL